jgi:hypothetical protein
MILNIFVKAKINFRYVQIWLWVCLLKEKLTLDISKYDFEYDHEREAWFQTSLSMILITFVKGKVDSRHVQNWLWVFLSKEKLTFNISKCDFNYFYQKKSWLQTCPNMTLGMFIKRKVDFRHVQIWLWMCLSKEKLILDMSKYDSEYVCQRKGWF